MRRVILHYPDHAVAKLEEVSYLIKHSDTLKMDEYLKVSDFRDYKDVCQEMDAYIKAMKSTFPQKKVAVEGEEEEAPEEVPAVGFVTDLLADCQMY